MKRLFSSPFSLQKQWLIVKFVQYNSIQSVANVIDFRFAASISSLALYIITDFAFFHGVEHFPLFYNIFIIATINFAAFSLSNFQIRKIISPDHRCAKLIFFTLHKSFSNDTS
jgi:hypothetical protein